MSLTLSWFLNLDFSQVEKSLAKAVSDHSLPSLLFRRGLIVPKSCIMRLCRAGRKLVREHVDGKFKIRYMETVFVPPQGFAHAFEVTTAHRQLMVMMPMRLSHFAACAAEDEGTVWISATCPRCGSCARVDVEVLLRDPMAVGS